MLVEVAVVGGKRQRRPKLPSPTGVASEGHSAAFTQAPHSRYFAFLQRPQRPVCTLQAWQLGSGHAQVAPVSESVRGSQLGLRGVVVVVGAMAVVVVVVRMMVVELVVVRTVSARVLEESPLTTSEPECSSVPV